MTRRKDRSLVSMHEHLELLILDSSSDKHAVLVARTGESVAIGQLEMGQEFSALLAFRDSIEKALLGRGQRPPKSDLTAFGTKLFGLIFRDEFLRLYGRLSNGNVSIHILSNTPSIKTLPWEFLQDPTRPSGPQAERCIVRVVPTIGIAAPPTRSLKSNMRILFCSADPIDVPGVSWTDVKQTIERAYHSQIPERFLMTAVQGTTRDSLRKILLRERFDIFHFFGHGEVKDGTGHLVLVDPQTGKSELIASEELATILAGKGVRLAILSACLTSAGNFSDDFSSVAGALIKAGIPAVVANQLSIPNKSVAAFVGAMYEELLVSGDIDRAVNAGRIALAINLGGVLDGGAVLEWGIPTLYRLFGANQIFQP